MQAPYELSSFMSAFAHAAVGMAITDLNGRFVGVSGYGNSSELSHYSRQQRK